jgi:hypothetical protein
MFDTRVTSPAKNRNRFQRSFSFLKMNAKAAGERWKERKALPTGLEPQL